jgi:AraC-like DNA-binding protein
VIGNISSLFSARLVRAATAQGLVAADLWRVLGIEVSESDMPPVPAYRHLGLWEHVMRELRDPGFPITYSRTMSIDDYGVLGLACKTAPTVRDAVAVLERYITIYVEQLQAKLEGDAIVITPVMTQTVGIRAASEAALAEMLGSLRIKELDVLLVAQSEHTASWAVRTRNEAMRQLPGPLDIASIARRLGISDRTLQRRLSDEDTRFEAIIDAVRLELAQALLEDRQRSIAEIATACGFTETSSFSRAYRRWTGSSPRSSRST